MGRPQFYDLMRRRWNLYFCAFDVLAVGNAGPLVERKARSVAVVPAESRVLYAAHFERTGVDLFRVVCHHDPRKGSSHRCARRISGRPRRADELVEVEEPGVFAGGGNGGSCSRGE